MTDILNIVPEAAGLSTFQPDPLDERLVRDALAYLVVRAPFFAHLFYHNMKIAFTYEVPIAATDAHTIFLNPDGIREHKMTIQEVAFVLVHEVAHYFFGDLLMMKKFAKDEKVTVGNKILDYHHELMNVAEDYRINAMLIDSKIGKFPSCGLFDPKISQKGMELAVDIYAILYKKSGGKGGSGGNQPGGQGTGTIAGQGHGGFDIHLKPAAKAAKEDQSGKRTQSIAAAAQVAGQGNLPACIQRIIGEILEPVVSWQDQLKSTMIRKGGDPTYDWRYLDKRMLARAEPMYFARQAHTGAGTIVVAVDTSGSIGPNELNRFFAELGGIIVDLNPLELAVLWCDAEIYNVNLLDEPEDVLDLKADLELQGGVKGGGGTDFRPVFTWIDEQDMVPDMLVYLTDTYGTFPEIEPDYPVVWAVLGNGKVPWGETVEVTL